MTSSHYAIPKLPPQRQTPDQQAPWVLYQSARLNAFLAQSALSLRYGFTGKPLSLGGSALSVEERTKNRLLLAQEAGLSVTIPVLAPEQIHSDIALLNQEALSTGCDAVIITEPGLPAIVQAADCVPVLLLDPKACVGAVIHAGWRGTAASITLKTALKLSALTGNPPETLLAVIGPSAGGCCYEVSHEVYNALSQSLATKEKQALPSWCLPSRPEESHCLEPHYYVDLKRVNQAQLASLGLGTPKASGWIDIIEACTLCLPAFLWSHRRGETGRQVLYLEFGLVS
ncbi:MAG: polyphenol oxidase family protein [Cyanobacteria bacterium]|nr:polyphenol oxidase family protein [Cyanobacteriota bacterium]